MEKHVSSIFRATVSAVMMQNGYMGGLQGWWPIRKVERAVADRKWARQPGLVNGKCETRNRNSVFPMVIRATCHNLFMTDMTYFCRQLQPLSGDTVTM